MTETGVVGGLQLLCKLGMCEDRNGRHTLGNMRVHKAQAQQLLVKH